jgi:hypothetical protein
VIPAGGSGRLVAKVRTRSNQNGKFSKSVAITTDAPGMENLRLSMTFNVVAAIVMKPRGNLFLNAIQGQGGSAKLLLHRADGKPLEAEASRAGLPVNVQVQTRAVTATDADEGQLDPQPGDIWIEVVLSDDTPPLNRNATITVTTNHPEAPRLTIPLMIRVRPLFEIRPARVALWASGDAPGGESAVFRVSHSRREAFEIDAIQVSHPEVFSAVAMSADQRPVHSIRVRRADDLDAATIASTIRGNVRISVVGPTEEVLEVSVRIEPRRDRIRPQRRGARRPIPTPPVG